MKYAIVRFTQEEDSPGIISTNWINEEGNTCLYPNVKTEYIKNKILLQRKSPGKDWLQCPIRVLRKFADYKAAKSHISEAEDTSNLESESEVKSIKRKRKLVFLPEEQSTSEEDEITKKTRNENSVIDLYPKPPSFESCGIFRDCSNKVSLNCNQGSKSSSEIVKPSLQPLSSQTSGRSNLNSQMAFNKEELLYSKNSLCSGSKSSSEIVKPSLQPLSSQTSERSNLNSQMAVNKEELLYSINSLCSGLSSDLWQMKVKFQAIGNVQSDIEQMKLELQTMANVQTELISITKQMGSKIDLLFARFTEQPLSNTPDQRMQSEDVILLSRLPMNKDDFTLLNEKLAMDSTFRQKLTKILVSVGGRDVKAFAANCLRKVLIDEVGENFSLTGKQNKNNQAKQSFQKTEAYKLILETCLRTFSNAKENVVREAVSDWLMQAKFRKSRRESRMKSTQEVSSNPTQDKNED